MASSRLAVALCLLVVVSLAGLVGAVFFKRAAVAIQLNSWQVLPRPERMSQLYFTDYRQLPVSLAPGAKQKLAFTVHNFEHQTTTYHYQLIAGVVGSKTEWPLGNGLFTLAQGQSLTTHRTITLPPLDARMLVQIKLDYKGITAGNDMPSVQTQSIDYWVRLTKPSSPNGGKHAAG